MNTQARLTPAQQKLVADNLNFIRHQVSKFIKSRNLSWNMADELYQEGVLGMCRAASDFQPERGIKFITYACAWVDLHLRKGLGSMANVIKPPAKLPKKMNELARPVDSSVLMYLTTDYSVELEKSRIKRLVTEKLLSSGVKQRSIDWYFELLEGDTDQVRIANKAGVNKNTVKNAMYQIRDILLEWGDEMNERAFLGSRASPRAG